jgi:hypothetical protein
VQAEREEQKKAKEAAGDTRAWNSLFMNANTVSFQASKLGGVDCKLKLYLVQGGDTKRRKRV